MATANRVINRAFRENNLLPLGTTPSDAQRAEALEALNDLITSWFGRVIGVFLSDWTVPPARTAPVPARYPMPPRNTDLPESVWPYPPENSRLLLNLTTPTTVYFPGAPPDGARITVINVGTDLVADPLYVEGNGRLVAGAANYTFDNNDLAPAEFFYRADRGEWVLLGTFTGDDELPLPKEFDDFVVASLAYRLSPSYGKELDQATGSVITYGLKMLETRYRQPTPEPAWNDSARVQTLQSYNRWGWM